MKTSRPHLLCLLIPLVCTHATAAANANTGAATVVLDDVAVKNLRIETAVVEEAAFEDTVFALGRIRVDPARRAVISSRVPGRAVEVLIKNDHSIQKGDIVMVLESRQPGDPPPRVTLTAPISGLVSENRAVPGQPIEPSDALAEILDLAEVYAVAHVPELLAGRLKRGQPARITVPAVPDQVFAAAIEHLGTAADPAGNTLEVAFRVQNPDLVLRPGMRAEFSIVVDRRENVFSVPREALQGDAANRFVYVKDFELKNAFVKTPVVVGRTNDRSVEILSGLFPADEVVGRGSYFLGFAGSGTLSLKEALDAAHGHEHAADGSELSDRDRSRAPPDAAHPHHDVAGAGGFWRIVSGVLFALLLLSLFQRRKGAANA